MKIIKNTILSILLAAFTACSSAYAAAYDDYELGKQKFEHGEYEQSLKYFKRAESQGMKSVQFYYNMGSVYYKLEKYVLSRSYFEKITASKKMGALAYYNLALIAHKVGNDAEAIALFNKCIKNTKDERLAQRAKKQITKINTLSQHNWSSYVFAKYGHDSNISAAPDNIVTNQSSAFIEANAKVSLWLSDKKNPGFSTFANIYSNNYTISDLYDYDVFSIGINYQHKISNWKIKYGAEVSKSTYGTLDYQDINAITINSKMKAKDNNQWRLKYKYEDITSRNTLYDYLSGQSQKIRAEYRVKYPTDEVRLQYELELNSRLNTATINYSPVRNRFIVSYIKTLSELNKFNIAVLYRNSDYEVTPARDRQDDRLKLSAAYTRKLDKNWKVKAEASQTQNNSTVPTLQFDRTVASIMLSHYYK